METVRPVDSGHGIIGCSGDSGNGTSGPIRVFKPTVSPLALIGFQGRGFVDGVQPDFCLSLLLGALIFQ